MTLQSPFDLTSDLAVRVAAFDWLRRQVEGHDDALPRKVLADGFELRGVRVPLLGPQGIFKPRIMHLPLSITTAYQGPYDDSLDSEGMLAYRYRGTDPEHRDNVGLRQCMVHNVPLVYLYGAAVNRYLATWPVFIVGDRPDALTFAVQVDEPQDAYGLLAGVTESDEGRRRYITAVTRHRLHQQAFRERVLAAYRESCAVCRLRHRELLESAHIVPDTEPHGEPIVPNGLALCQLHHAAYDKHVIGITPDYVVEVRPDVLTEADGPMLLHGLQGVHLTRLNVPHPENLRPDPERLAWRYRRFKGAA